MQKVLYQVIPIRRHFSYNASLHGGLVPRYNVPFHVQMCRDNFSVPHRHIARHYATTTTLCTIAVHCAKACRHITTIIDNTASICICRIISYGTVCKGKLSMRGRKNPSAAEKSRRAFKGTKDIDSRCDI